MKHERQESQDLTRCATPGCKGEPWHSRTLYCKQCINDLRSENRYDWAEERAARFEEPDHDGRAY